VYIYLAVNIILFLAPKVLYDVLKRIFLSVVINLLEKSYSLWENMAL